MLQNQHGEAKISELIIFMLQLHNLDVMNLKDMSYTQT